MSELKLSNGLPVWKAKEIMSEVDDMDLPDGAHWSLIHERLNLSYGDLFQQREEVMRALGFSDPE